MEGIFFGKGVAVGMNLISSEPQLFKKILGTVNAGLC